MTNGLRQAPPGAIDALARTATCAVSATAFPDWEKRAKEGYNDPVPHMRAQLQRINDCQGQSLCSGTEKRHWIVTGKMIQRSDMYAYNGSEAIDGSVGRNIGSTITAGVRLLTEGPGSGIKPGIAFEEDWPYTQYLRSQAQFYAQAQSTPIEDSYLTQHQPLPSFEDMCAACVAGATGHIGTWWGNIAWVPRGDSREMSQVPRGGGGHATEVLYPRFVEGAWRLLTWNSHGDRYYYIPERVWNQMVDEQFQPFGGALLIPDVAEERWEDWDLERWRKELRS